MRWPWFTRRWIVQEIALARKASMFCGPDEIQWNDFCQAVDLFKLYYDDIKSCFLSAKFNFSKNWLGEVQALGACRLVEITNNLFRKSSDGTIQRRLVTLESLVSRLTMFIANRPHDTIYAVIALAKDIKTTVQKSYSVEHGASPVTTPAREEHLDDINNEQTNQRKRKRGLKDEGRPMRARLRRGIVHVIRDKTDCQFPLHHEDTRSRKPIEKLQEIVHEIVRVSPASFRVDYNKTFLQVCIDFVEFAISRSHSLDVICRPWVPEALREKENLPSWLLDVDAYPFRPGANGTFDRVNGDPLVGLNAMEPKRYSACGPNSQARRIDRSRPTNGWGFCCKDRDSDFEHDYWTEHRSLFVSGFVYDIVDQIKEKAEDGLIPGSWFEFAGWKDRSRVPPDDLWRTLVADRESDGGHVGTFYSTTLRDIMHKYCVPRGPFNVKRLLETPKEDRRALRVLNRILAITPNRRLFKTTSRTGQLLGLAPAKAEKGDLVCILFGCSVPVILRPKEEQVGDHACQCYEFIGEAYVHGLMEGHALDDDETTGGPIKFQQFELR